MTQLLILGSGLVLGALYARLLPVIIEGWRRRNAMSPELFNDLVTSIRQAGAHFRERERAKQERAWDKFEGDYHSQGQGYHPEGHNGNGMPDWY